MTISSTLAAEEAVLGEMLDLDIPPLVPEVLGYEPPMAMMRFILAA